jgi:uncharacterized protein YecT (DUF1311 family)
MSRRAVIFIFAIFIGGLATIRAPQAEPQRPLDQEACDARTRASAELDRLYSELLRRVANRPKLVAAIRASQETWVRFQKAQVAALYEVDDPAAYGSVRPMCACAAREELAKMRASQLKRMLKGDEGDVCSWQRVR